VFRANLGIGQQCKATINVMSKMQSVWVLMLIFKYLLTSGCTECRATQKLFLQEPILASCDNILQNIQSSTLPTSWNYLPEMTKASLGPQVTNPQVMLSNVTSQTGVVFRFLD
jgi:hypothetical protein